AAGAVPPDRTFTDRCGSGFLRAPPHFLDRFPAATGRDAEDARQSQAPRKGDGHRPRPAGFSEDFLSALDPQRQPELLGLHHVVGSADRGARRSAGRGGESELRRVGAVANCDGDRERMHPLAVGIHGSSGQVGRHRRQRRQHGQHRRLIVARKAKATWDIRAKGLTAPESKRFVVYGSDEMHTWISKATDICGLGTDAVRWIKSDDDHRIRPDVLRKQIVADRKAGLYPFMVCGTAGSVGTGAIDPLNDLAKICEEFDLWFHVDGAYGAPAVALDDASADLKGLRLADSIAIDPHKWLYAPLEAGCTLVRRKDDLHDAFSSKPSYYQFDDNEGQEVKNYYEYGPQNSRGFRALKIWLGFQQSGASGYRRMIADDIELARRLHEFVGEEELLEQGTQSLSITTFRYVPADLRKRAMEPGRVTDYLNELNARIATALRLGGKAFFSNAHFGDRYMLRACIVNFRTTLADVELLPKLIVEIGRKLDAERRPPELKRAKRGACSGR